MEDGEVFFVWILFKEGLDPIVEGREVVFSERVPFVDGSFGDGSKDGVCFASSGLN